MAEDISIYEGCTLMLRLRKGLLPTVDIVLSQSA
jgi:hypothetical protein